MKKFPASVLIGWLATAAIPAHAQNPFGVPTGGGRDAAAAATPVVAPPRIASGEDLRKFLSGTSWTWKWTNTHHPAEMITFMPDGTVKHQMFVARINVATATATDLELQFNGETARLKFDSSCQHFNGIDFNGERPISCELQTHPLAPVATPAPALVFAGSAAENYLGLDKAQSVTVGWRTAQNGLSIEMNPLKIGGTPFKQGLGLHVPTEVVYQLDGRQRWLTFYTGVDAEVPQNGSIKLAVKLDGVQIYQSPRLDRKDGPLYVSLPISGTREVRFIGTDAGAPGGHHDHLDICNLRVSSAPIEPRPDGPLPSPPNPAASTPGTPATPMQPPGTFAALLPGPAAATPPPVATPLPAATPFRHSLVLTAETVSAGASTKIKTGNRTGSANGPGSGSFSFDAFQEQTSAQSEAIRVGLHNLGRVPDTARVEWYFMAGPLKPDLRRPLAEQDYVYDKGSQNLTVQPNLTESISCESKAVYSISQRSAGGMGGGGKNLRKTYAAASNEFGTAFRGWMVRVVADGQILATSGSKQAYADMMRNTTQFPLP